MPPLCTAGYGLASGNWHFFLGAFYLFFINAVFIALSTFLIVKYLDFPIKQYVDKALQRRYTQLSGIFVALALLPSVYFLYTVYTDSRTKKTIEALVISNLEKEGNEVLKWNIENRDSIKLVNVYYSGVQVEDVRLRQMEALCTANGLDRCRINALRVNLTKEEVTGLTKDAANDMLNQWQIKMREKQREDSLQDNHWKTEALRIERELVALSRL